MSPFDRLKPYFKPRPRARAAPQQPATQVQVPQSAPPPAAAAPPAAGADGLAGRRDELARRYQELQSDLGGLVYEMARRDAFRLDVVVRRAAELQAVDAELAGVEQALRAGAPATSTASCPRCGAVAAPGTAFCGSCGTPLGAPASGSQVPGRPA